MFSLIQFPQIWRRFDIQHTVERWRNDQNSFIIAGNHSNRNRIETHQLQCNCKRSNIWVFSNFETLLLPLVQLTRLICVVTVLWSECNCVRLQTIWKEKKTKNNKRNKTHNMSTTASQRKHILMKCYECTNNYMGTFNKFHSRKIHSKWCIGVYGRSTFMNSISIFILTIFHDRFDTMSIF